MQSDSHTNLKNALSSLTAVANNLESKIKQSHFDANLQNALNGLAAVTKNLESRIKQTESSSDKIGPMPVSKLMITVSDLSEAMARKKRERDNSRRQIPAETGSPQSTQTNLQNALSSLTAVARNLESKIKQTESASDKIGQILVSKKVITVSDLSEAMERKKQEPSKYLGQILCDMGLPQSRIIKGIHYSNKRKKLGQVFVELHMITETQLQDSLLQQTYLKNRGMHTPLGALLAKNGIIREAHYIQALSAHFSMPIVSLKGYQVNPSLQKVIGEKYALENHIVVLSNSAAKATVATSDPHLSVIETLEKALPKGKYIMFYLASPSEIEICLDKTYNLYRILPGRRRSSLTDVRKV